MGTGYYRYDARNFSYRELANINGANSWLAWTFKTLRIRWGSAWARRFPSSIQEWLIPRALLSQQAAIGLNEMRAQLEALGFESIGILGPRGSLSPSESAYELFRHKSGDSIAGASLERSGNVERKSIRIASVQSDGQVLTTLDRVTFDPQPGTIRQHLKNASAAQLFAAHQTRLSQPGAAPIKPFADATEALDFFYQSEVAEWNWLIKRGLLIECTDVEVESARRRLDKLGIDPEHPNPDPNAPALLEMLVATERTQTWREVAWAFSITLVLFIVAGLLRWDTEFLWLLVGALILHETGHYITMRAFGFRNLRMIFVPLGGAAVIGQHFNLAGWKKAIVSLMGPLPGILLGAAIAFLNWKAGLPPILVNAALVLLIVNGLNLLPVFPLDGGACLTSILFCRNAKLEVVSKAIAVLILAIAALAFKDFLLGALAYVLIVGLRQTFRLARLTEQLRRELTVPNVDDRNELPIEIKTRVLEGVKAALTRPAVAKTLATHALGIFGRLNARPPGFFGTATLLLVYILSFGLSIAAFVGLNLTKRRQAIAAKPIAPNIPWFCAGAPATPVQIPKRLAIITFEKSSDLLAFVQTIEKRLPTNAPSVIGNAVFLPYDVKQVFTLSTSIAFNHGHHAFEHARAHVTTHWSFSAPNKEVADEIEEEIENYAALPAFLSAFPPWTPRTLGDLVHDPRERQTRRAIRDLVEIQHAIDDSEIDKLDEQRSEEGSVGDLAETKWRTAVVAHLQRAIATNSNGLDPEVAGWYTNYLVAPDNFKFLQGPGAEVARRIGRPERPEDFPKSRLVSSPELTRNGAKFNFHYARFFDIGAGFPAFGNWLCARGCTNIHYTLRNEK